MSLSCQNNEWMTWLGIHTCVSWGNLIRLLVTKHAWHIWDKNVRIRNERRSNPGPCIYSFSFWWRSAEPFNRLNYTHIQFWWTVHSNLLIRLMNFHSRFLTLTCIKFLVKRQTMYHRESKHFAIRTNCCAARGTSKTIRATMTFLITTQLQQLNRKHAISRTIYTKSDIRRVCTI